VIFAFLLALGQPAQAAERRVAFVVGNSSYVNVPVLPNPANDAEAVAKALRKSGFEVVTAFDLRRAQFDSEFQKFIRSLAGADISLFYYSGHGIQVGGDNRIVPVDARLSRSLDMEVETISLRTIMSYMQSNSKSQLVYLDSCRNNPFPSSSFLVGPDKEVAVAAAGLAAQEAAVGSLIAFSTQPGSVAVDGTGSLSPFTESVIKHSFKLGVDVQTALMRVTQEVWEATRKQQRPWASSTLVEPVYLALPTIMIASQESEPQVVQVPAITVDNTGQAEEQVVTASSEGLAQHLQQVFAKPQPVPIGVGPVALLGDLPVLRSGAGTRVELARSPAAGVLYLDGQPLLEGSSLDEASLRKVSFEPAIGTEGRVDGMELRVVQQEASAVTVEGKVQPFVVDCDQEAGEPLDLQGVSKGRLPNEIEPERAIVACMKAAAEFPEVARYKYQLGRAKLAARDVEGATDLFNAAAKQGHVRAYYQLGYMAQRGVGRSIDLAEANRLFKIGVEQGDPFAMLTYGRNLVLGRGVEKNTSEGMALLNRAAELGHTYAMNELGAIYYYGRGVKQNPQRGVRFYEAALARDDIYAMNNIGLAYLEGKGVKKDAVTALALFMRASESGHPTAPTNIGIMFYEGDGVRKDLSKAIEWYMIGAERGDTFAASNLGYIYANGPRKLRDVEKAVWYESMAAGLDAFGSNPAALEALKKLPNAAKAKAIKKMIAEIGVDERLETAADLDGTLAILARKVWQKRNPRLDLF
jgi:uncharacterized caspase-like protein